MTGLNRLVVSLFVALVAITGTATAKEMNEKAKDFTLPSRSGENVRLAELQGEVVLVNFWASWCGPCRKELPKLEEMHQKYKDLGVTILGINIDETRELSQKLLKDTFANKVKMRKLKCQNASESRDESVDFSAP